jgi:Mg2+ and Co2+ transporter CorA
MNLELPFEGATWGPIIVLLISFFIMGVITAVFARRNWF